MTFTYRNILQDVCVPLSHLAELISISKKELDASPLLWYVCSKKNAHVCLKNIEFSAGRINYYTAQLPGNKISGGPTYDYLVLTLKSFH